MICIPITASSNKEAIKDIRIANRLADLVEIRLDITPNLDLIKKVKKPVIVTNRKKTEGGKFKGSEKQRISIIKKSLQLNPDFVDIELTSGKIAINNIKKLIKKNKRKTKLIISFHNLKKTDKKQINLIFNKIKRLNPDIIKIVTFANSIDDNITILNLIKKSNKKIIALCMGKRGEVSRIISPLIGGFLTFACLKKGKESAPGQISAKVLKNVYRINKLKNPQIYGLVGNPVEHSKGYIIHNKSFARLKLKKIYVNFLVDDIKSFIKNFKKIIDGLSVTIPHKGSIIRHLDKVDNTAKKIGAVNTVVKNNNKLIGYNTDYSGAIKAIKNIKRKNIAIIGAGGVARAIAFGIIKEKGKLIILNRTVKKAVKLGKELKCESGGLDKIRKLKNIDILINCTSIGMFPKINKTPINKKLLKKIMSKKGLVFDTVYNPVNTDLLKDAKKLKLRTVSGVELFINQAAEQFKLWTGKNMPNVKGLI